MYAARKPWTLPGLWPPFSLGRKQPRPWPLLTQSHRYTISVMLCYSRRMKNITVTVPEEVYRQARIHAAKQGRSVSAMVSDYLAGLTERNAEFIRLEQLQRTVQADITRFRASDRLARERVHDRALR